MRKELTFTELDTETAELLPARETLFFNKYNWAGISATNSSLAVNAGSHFSVAHSAALQAISVNQS
ncbi:hypothetical protein EKO23_16590 [Nocardioides guangzhouensis]|uniref:Uncharacterized protein n=1 Tax=Nocardioides guangzhouensis TaxID=2497878 RepID=A0A4Q4Z8P8_9ACTN|nr:hypothetical protein [Nocardioides guangzhouensis]RYP84270.1 hypothetical protein EKO23_16590 [Nocardioides guangzhouensis]